MAFANPNVHRVTRIEAASELFMSGGKPHVYLDLNFSQDNGDDAEMSIFGDADMRDKFERLAAAINEIFGGEAHG